MPFSVPGMIVEALRRSTVQIHGKGRVDGGSGSGGVLHSEQIVTNAHVVMGRELIAETWDGQTLPIQLVKLDRRRDLALLRAPGIAAPPLVFADSSTIRAGTPVIAVGNPLGFIGAVSSGVVHAVGSIARLAGRWIQADVRLAPGNSGGPLATFGGEVIGINTMVVFGGLGLAIPSRAVQSFLKRQSSKPLLGITLRPVKAPEGGFALLILELTEGGAAEAASLLPGDLLLAVDGHPLRFAEDLEQALEETTGRQTLEIEFRRGGQQQTRRVVVKIDAQQASKAA